MNLPMLFLQLRPPTTAVEMVIGATLPTKIVLGILAVSSYGLYRLMGDPFKKPEKKSLFSVIPLPNMSSGPFKSVGPEPAVILTRPFAVAITPNSGDLVLFSRGELNVLKKQDDGRFELAINKKVDVPSGKDITLAAAGDSVLIGRDDGALLIYDAATLELKKELEPESRSVPALISASPDGKTYAVTFKNGNLWLVHADNLEAEKARVRGQGEICATRFLGNTRMLITHQSVRVYEYELSSGKVGKTHTPSATQKPETLG